VYREPSEKSIETDIKHIPIWKMRIKSIEMGINPHELKKPRVETLQGNGKARWLVEAEAASAVAACIPKTKTGGVAVEEDALTRVRALLLIFQGFPLAASCLSRGRTRMETEIFSMRSKLRSALLFRSKAVAATCDSGEETEEEKLRLSEFFPSCFSLQNLLSFQCVVETGFIDLII
jgi:hypothetical protein